jgi:3',5'-nucleoside bisphosphate phosphatase
MVELQAHSTVSDGELPPASVVQAAAAAGVSTLALTDHDAVDGVAEAEHAAGQAGVELVPATEMSAVHELADDLHILGYHVDVERLRPACERAQDERKSRAAEIVAKLNQLGVRCRFEDAIAAAGDAASVGRPHIARAAGASGDLGPFFEEYLVPGAKAFVARRWPTAAEAVELIHGAGGFAVLAHPFWDLDEEEEVAGLIEHLDVDGVECFYPTHSREHAEFLLALCRDRGLFPTGSSDFHGPGHKQFSRFGAYETYGLGQPALPPPPEE